MQQAQTSLSGSGQEPSQDEINALLDQLGVAPGANLIGILQDVQDCFGYLPTEAVDKISRRARIPLSRIYGVISFYSQFYTEPRGRHTVRACRGTACHVKGAGGVLEAIERTLGIRDGESTPDLRFFLETVACLGTCFLAPVMMIDNEYFGNLAPGKIETILANYPTDE